MIDQGDWVFAFTEQGSNVPPKFKPTAKDRKTCAGQPLAVRLVAKALAKTKQEDHPDAWMCYIGMAVTWLADGGDVALAIHKTDRAPKRRKDR